MNKYKFLFQQLVDYLLESNYRRGIYYYVGGYWLYSHGFDQETFPQAHYKASISKDGRLKIIELFR